MVEDVSGGIFAAAFPIVENCLKSEDSTSDGEDGLAPTILGHSHDPLEIRPRIQLYVENVVARYTNAEFKCHFRMERETFESLLRLIAPLISRKNKKMGEHRSGRTTIPPEKQLMVTLWTMATPDSYRAVSYRFDIGRATAMRTIRRVTIALCKFAPEYIKWPLADQAEEMWKQFQLKYGFPKVLGVIGTTHINIAVPRENAEAYVDGKGNHCIQLQVVCDHSMLFTHYYTEKVGWVHDKALHSRSGSREFFTEERFPQNCHLIGDATHAIHEYMMVPFEDNGCLTARQKNYNYCHSSTRMVVERSLALLKWRFRCLRDRIPMTRADLIPEFILACCVLHNICLLKNDLIEVPIAVNNDETDIAHRFVDIKERLEGIKKRIEITDNLPFKPMRNA